MGLLSCCSVLRSDSQIPAAAFTTDQRQSTGATSFEHDHVDVGELLVSNNKILASEFSRLHGLTFRRGSGGLEDKSAASYLQLLSLLAALEVIVRLDDYSEIYLSGIYCSQPVAIPIIVSLAEFFPQANGEWTRASVRDALNVIVGGLGAQFMSEEPSKPTKFGAHWDSISGSWSDGDGEKKRFTVSCALCTNAESAVEDYERDVAK